jgi:hypothetical protein
LLVDLAAEVETGGAREVPEKTVLGTSLVGTAVIGGDFRRYHDPRGELRKRQGSRFGNLRGKPRTPLTEANAKHAKKREANFSGLLDRLLAAWIA